MSAVLWKIQRTGKWRIGRDVCHWEGIRAIGEVYVVNIVRFDEVAREVCMLGFVHT